MSESLPLPQALDVLTLPLHGERLIEASAGTGKTYTIAGLYIRLLLGHGANNSAHQRPLSVDQILVVTFTDAATGELRERIRARIVNARHAFLAGFSDDPLLSSLLDDSRDHAQDASLLLQALRQMDEAAIFTIHGFCQRMLTQHAFESGSYFETEFVTDETQLRNQVIEDYWRENFYATQSPIDYTLASIVRSYWSSPQQLLAQVASLLTNPFLIEKDGDKTSDIKGYLSEQIARVDQVKQLWLASADDILPAITSKDIDKRSYSSKNLPKWFDEVSLWAQAPTNSLVLPKSLARFSLTMLVEKTKSGESPQHPVFSAIETLLSSPSKIKEMLLSRALNYLKVNIALHKKQASLLSFDDLLMGLAGSLNQQGSGQLACAIREQYPLAMIDEFQDTDLLQYQIFNTVYGQQQDSGLLMIGDPKQAIYGFRGADIFTYISARRQVHDHYTLGVNYRSSQDMVSAVNTLFTQSDAPFIYQQDIAFHPVKHNPSDVVFQVDNQAKGALTQWLMPDDNAVSTVVYQQSMALACATTINQLLTKGQDNSAGFISAKGTIGVAASDIAILVRTGREATLVRNALAKQGISSVYLSNRDSVFASIIANDVWQILQAIVEPTNARLLRSAMATAVMGLDASALDKLNNDETVWQQAVDLMCYFYQRWCTVGVLAMLREFIHRHQLPSKLLARVDGERQVTDLMHIGELLQQQSLEVQGEHALIHWLGDKISHVAQDDQAQQLRLESDKDLVQIVTIHKSKGLEYNLVFLPFMCAARPATQALYHDDGQSFIDLSNGEETLALADKERLAEDLRLLYVAITRAVHHCWIGFGPLKKTKATKDGKTDLHKSALGYLLLGNDVSTVSELSDKLHQLASQHDYINIEQPPSEPLTPYLAKAPTLTSVSAREFSQPIENNYWITSYSALSKHSQHGVKVNVDASEELFELDMEAEQVALEQASEQSPELNAFTFPRGAHAGTFLHLLFEEIEFNSSNIDARNEVIATLLDESEFDNEWLDMVIKLVDDVLAAPLEQQFSLNQLSKQKMVVEMEFFMPIANLDCGALNQLLAKHDPLSKQAHELNFARVQGMLKGFIDLVFEHQGRYYVLDYKSNHLGDSFDCYSGEAMTAAMIDHRYDFQYQLYSLALHRFLRSRLPDYDYEQHFGGAYYLFLRGIDRESRAQDSGVFYNRPSQEFIEQLDQLFDDTPLIEQGKEV